MSSPTATLLGLTPEKVRAILARNGAKLPEPLTNKAVNQLCRLKAAEVQKQSMRKARKK